jgi:acyl carrier protein
MGVCYSLTFFEKAVHRITLMRELTELELAVAKLIVETLNLESVEAGDINPDDSLFGEGLGLDSIDALELALAMKQTYGINIKSGDSENTKIFSSLASLTDFIAENKTN